MPEYDELSLLREMAESMAKTGSCGKGTTYNSEDDFKRVDLLGVEQRVPRLHAEWILRFPSESDA